MGWLVRVLLSGHPEVRSRQIRAQQSAESCLPSIELHIEIQPCDSVMVCSCAKAASRIESQYLTY